MQQGSLYVVGTGADSACYLKYRTTDENGNRVHKTVLLCKRDKRYDWWFKRGKWGFSSAVRDLQRTTMERINAYATALELARTATPEAKDEATIGSLHSGIRCSFPTARRFVRSRANRE